MVEFVALVAHHTRGLCGFEDPSEYVHGGTPQELSLCDVVLMASGPAQAILSLQPKIVRGVRPRGVSVSFSERFSNLLMSVGKKLNLMPYLPGCLWTQSILLQRMFRRPGWSVRERHLTISITSNCTQSPRRIAPRAFTQFSASTISLLKVTQGTHSRPPLPADCSCS